MYYIGQGINGIFRNDQRIIAQTHYRASMTVASVFLNQ